MTEDEEYQLMHILRGDHQKPGCCEERCADPMCEYGCLRVEAVLSHRWEIVAGVTYLREQGDPRFPLTVNQGIKKDCVGNGNCTDPICHVTGCLKQPSWKFRDLIKAGQGAKLIKALKKQPRQYNNK